MQNTLRWINGKYFSNDGDPLELLIIDVITSYVSVKHFDLNVGVFFGFF